MGIFQKPPLPQPFRAVGNIPVFDVGARHVRLFCTPKVNRWHAVIFALSYMHVIPQLKKNVPPSTLPLPIIPYSSDWPKLTPARLEDSLYPSRQNAERRSQPLGIVKVHPQS